MMHFRNALGLDIGQKRIGVARINAIAQIPEPLVTLANDADVINKVQELIKEHDVDLLVCGVPRNMSGAETQQSRDIRDFIDFLQANLTTRIVTQDETLTTVDAEELLQKGIKGDKDSVAAGYILADYVTRMRLDNV